jgi:hypothetical protein
VGSSCMANVARVASLLWLDSERERERLGSSCMANVAHVASLLWLDSISFVNLRNVCPERKKNFVLILLGIIKINVVHMLSIERHNKNIYILDSCKNDID